MGLLAALLLFAGGVGGVVWFVIRNNPPKEPVATADPKTPGRSTSSFQDIKPVRLGEAAGKVSVTIVADPKAQAALAQLRKFTPDDGKPRKVASAPEKKATVKPAAQLDVDGQVVDWNSPEVRSAVELLKKFRAAKMWKEKLSLVHQSGQAQPLMEEFYGSQGQVDPSIAGLVGASNLKIGNRNVLALSYSSGDRLNRIVHANFWRDTGGLRLDWESFVGFSGKGMGTFRSSHCTVPTVFRVLAVPDDYYNFEFSDSKEFLCLRLYSPNGEDYLHGYCARDSADGRKIVEILGDSHTSSPAAASQNGLRSQVNEHFPITVQIAFPEQAQSDRCVRIEKFVAPWWLALDVEKQTTAALHIVSPGAANAR